MRPLLFPALLLALGELSAAGEFDLPVQETTLENGLKVLVLEDHAIPNAVTYTTWRVGSRNENVGATGLAHFFEHMMFQGGARYGAKFDTVMEARGGSNNAYTTRDVTVYQNWFPSSALELILDMEADRMGAMVFRPQTVETERGVVASERRSNMEVPASVMAEQLWAAAYTAHPYHWDVLGWMVDIQNWKQADLEQFFRANYAPNNATLAVVGAVDAGEVFRLVRAKMGPLQRQPERRPIHTKEPEQLGERRVVVENPRASLPQVMIAWHICETSHPDFAALDVLENLLFSGDSSRLVHLLVEHEQVCLGVGGGWQGFQFDPSLFTVELAMREGVPSARGEALVYGELARLASEGPGERELRKVKNGIRAEIVRRMATLDGKADLISETETFFGGWRNLPRRLEAIEAVTAEQVRKMLAKYFTVRNRTVVTLAIPEAPGCAQ